MILVTGGTGLVGSHLLYQLLKDGNKVRAIHRKGSNLGTVRKVFEYYTDEAQRLYEQIEWFEANVTDITRLEVAFRDIHYVYHAAAYVDFNPKNYPKLKKANIEGTANVVNLCIAHSVKKLCHVSSIATLGDTVGQQMITEETYWNPEVKNSVYAITKYGAEMEVWRGTQEGVPAVIVNPGVILGEGLWHKGSGSIVKRVAKGLKYYTGGGIGLVDVQDVARAMITLMTSEIENQRFILVATNVSYKAFITDLASALGTRPPTTYVAKWKLSLFSKLDWIMATLFGTKRKLLATHVNSLYTADQYHGGQIKKSLGFEYQPYKDTISRVASRFKEDNC